MKTYTQLIEELIEAHPLSTLAGARTRLARANTAHTLSTIYRLKPPNKPVTGHTRPYYPKRARANQERNIQRAKEAKEALKGHGESQANIDHIADAGKLMKGARVDGQEVHGFVGPIQGKEIKLKGGSLHQLKQKQVRDRKAKEIKPIYPIWPNPA